MAERPHHIPLPTGGLRSAMKHPSNPTTPLTSESVSPRSETPVTLSESNAHRSSMSGPSSSSIHSPQIQGGYLPKVSFDTFENPAAPMFSFTLQVKSEGYKRNRSTRVFLCAASPDESGSQALDWVMESLVQDGDELIVLRGFDTDELDKDHDTLREEAKELMRQIQRRNTENEPDRKLSIIVEFIAGKVTQTIERLIALYRPDSLVVGTRGVRGMKAWGGALAGMGSVSKYCLSHSPVPVIVVRPERKVRKAIEKRRADPKRGLHFEETKGSSDSLHSSPRLTPQPIR
ncbi:hypothetical protein BD410DRAFT_781812 [Rickenella mellea]|uniref:UspA domain-containing protein n=1 Tax=Rickenella mellea TaxID=50990 RepID=A0A4Y7QJP2_9AGAM|nr:hypothetical protein BD410DRAFT_781812 [Rickenella mellea]